MAQKILWVANRNVKTSWGSARPDLAKTKGIKNIRLKLLTFKYFKNLLNTYNF